MWLRRLRARPTELAFVVGLLLLAGGLRLYQFDRVPSPNETSDEYAYLWAGWTLLHEGTPTAWSEKGAYGAAPTYLWHQARYRLVSPWFDHPPLYALLVGAAASLRGGGELFDASLPAARLTAVAFATASTGLLYAWARAPYGRPAASLGALLFATIPTVVVAGRLALAESLIVPLQLLALIAAERYRGAPASPAARRAPWLALVLAAVVASVLAKVPGVAVGGSVGLFLAWRRLWGAALASLAAVLLGIAVFVAYGCALDCGLFRLVLADQGARARGFEALSRVLAGAMAEPLSWRDAWLPFLWLALAYAALRRDRLLAIAVLPYLVFTVAAVDQNEPRVWYRYPLFPYLCLAGGLFIRDAFRRPASLGLALLVFGVGFGKVGEAFPAWELLARVPRGQQLFPALVATCGALLAAPYVSRARWAVAAATSVGAAGLAAAIAASFWTVLHAESLHPPFRPASSFDIAAPTRVGFVLQRYDAHPTTLPPGGTLRLTVTGLLLEDASAVPTRAYLQPVDRRSKQRGAPRVLGAEAPLAGKSGEEVTLDLGGALPEEVGEGDYDVGVVVADEPIGLGLVRVRRSGGAEDEPLRPVGRPTVLGDRLVLERAGFGPAQTTADGRRHPVVLRLAPLRPTTAEYHVFVHATEAGGRRAAQADGVVGGQRRALWQTGEAVDDWRDLLFPNDTPPGRYYVTAGVYEFATGRRLLLPDGADSLPLGAIDVGRPLGLADVPRRLGARFDGGIELIGYEGGEEGAETRRLTLFWQAAGPVRRDYSVFLHVVDAAGSIVAQADGPPDRGRLPTTTWAPGQVIGDPREIHLPDRSARYRVLVGLYESPSGPRLRAAGVTDGAVEVTVLAPGP